MNIVLIGFKAAGKSSIGKSLARLEGMRFVDTDDVVERLYRERNGCALTCREIYRTLGAQAMRGLETEALKATGGTGKVGETALLNEADGKKETVIATGGGVVLAPENLPLLRAAGTVVFLDTPLPVLEARLEKHRHSPLFAEKSVAGVHNERLPLYLAAADVRVVPEAEDTPENTARRVRDAVTTFKESSHG